MTLEGVPSRSDVLLARLTCSLLDLAESQERDFRELEIAIKGEHAELLQIAHKCRKERSSVVAFFMASADIFGLSGSVDHFAFERRFKKHDPRRAHEINVERLWDAWAEFLHGIPLLPEEERI